MLYSPGWEHKVANPFTMEGLIAWLEKMPRAKGYDYVNSSGACLYGQYLAAHSVPWDEGGAVHTDFRNHVYRHVAWEQPQTFGAALARARKAPMHGYLQAIARARGNIR